MPSAVNFWDASTVDAPEPLPEQPTATLPERPTTTLPEPVEGRSPWIVALVIAALLTGAGLAVASWAFGWFDHDSRPANVLPAQVAGYVEIDFEPTPWQQLQAWSFLHDLPEVQASGGHPEPKKLFWQLLGKRLGYGTDADFAADIEPWLGERAGFALMSAPDEQSWMFAIELTDTDLGTTTLRRWIAESGQDYDVTAIDGYALITRGKHTDLVLTGLADGRLGGDPGFIADMAKVGDPGFFALWADLGRFAEPGATEETPRGRVAGALVLSGDAATIAGHATDLPLPAIEAAGRLGELPASSVAGFSVSGGTDAMPALWPSLAAHAEAWPQWSDVTEADVASLLGSSFSVAVFGESLFDGQFGLRTTTADPIRAEATLERVIAGTEYAGLQHRVEGEVLAAARGADQRDELAGTGPRLAGLPEFQGAVPDHARAIAAGYLDPDAVGWFSVEPGSAYAAFSGSIRAFGGQFLGTGAGTGDWALRVVRS